MKYRLYQKNEEGRIYQVGEEKTYKAICEVAKTFSRVLPADNLLLITKVFSDFETGYHFYQGTKPFHKTERYILAYLKGQVK